MILCKSFRDWEKFKSTGNKFSNFTTAYIFQSINEAMSKERDEMSIGVLDIYGFEIFEVWPHHRLILLPLLNKNLYYMAR